MISFLNGICAGVTADQILIDVSGVGFAVNVPTSCAERAPGIGETITLYTHLSVREDDLSLYGFLTTEERGMFRMLLGVSGVGPKVALGILSTLSTDDLKFAILTSDARLISRAPGVGKKTAERLVLELKDKFAAEDLLPASPERSAGAMPQTEEGAALEALEALTALGYARADALRAIRNANAPADTDTGTLLQMALKQLV